MTNRKLIICDLDNTLYDWVGYFVPSFYAMVDEAVSISKCDREELLNDFRDIHKRHHDSEHPFSLLETRTINKIYGDRPRSEIAQILDPAFYAFNSSRKRNLKLYPGVRESLDYLSRSGFVMVAHTESKLYAVVDRLTRLKLTDFFSRIYCRERPNSSHPNPDTGEKWLDQFPMQKVIELLHRQRKPNPEVLLEICKNENFGPDNSVYVGDSMTHDIVMAKAAGVFAIWAKYGANHEKNEYEKLIRISHWTEEDIIREKNLKEKAQGVEPDYILKNQFGELITFFDESNLALVSNQ